MAAEQTPSSIPEEHKATAPKTLGCWVLTVSDTKTPETDTSGALIRERLTAAGHLVVGSSIVRDEPIEDIADFLRAEVSGEGVGPDPHQVDPHSAEQGRRSDDVVMIRHIDGQVFDRELARALYERLRGRRAVAPKQIHEGEAFAAQHGSLGDGERPIDQVAAPRKEHDAALLAGGGDGGSHEGRVVIAASPAGSETTDVEDRRRPWFWGLDDNGQGVRRTSRSTNPVVDGQFVCACREVQGEHGLG